MLHLHWVLTHLELHQSGKRHPGEGENAGFQTLQHFQPCSRERLGAYLSA